MLRQLRIKRIRKKMKNLEYENELLELQYNYNKIGSGLYDYFKMRNDKQYSKLFKKLRKLYGN